MNVMRANPSSLIPDSMVPIYVQKMPNQFTTRSKQMLSLVDKPSFNYEKRKQFGKLSQNQKFQEIQRIKFSNISLLENTLKLKEQKQKFGQRANSLVTRNHHLGGKPA